MGAPSAWFLCLPGVECPGLSACLLGPVGILNGQHAAPGRSDPLRCERAFTGNTIGQANAVSDKILDLRFCSFPGAELKGKVLSGMQRLWGLMDLPRKSRADEECGWGGIRHFASTCSDAEVQLPGVKGGLWCVHNLSSGASQRSVWSATHTATLPSQARSC